MAILIDEQTRFIVQGSTDGANDFAAVNLPFYASSIVAYVSLDGGDLVGANRWLFGGTGIFATAAEAVAATGANASIVRTAPDRAFAAVEAAADAGLSLVIVVSEVPEAADRTRIAELARARDLCVIGPCAPGVISPGACQVGTMPGYIHSRGRVGILSRSGARCHEVALQTTAAGLGQSTVLALGRTPIAGDSLVSCFEMFLDDPQTEGIVLLGDAHGRVEEAVAEVVRRGRAGKPVVAHIEPDQETSVTAGQGDIWSISDAMAARKTEALRAAGVIVTDRPGDIGQIMRTLLELKDAGSAGNRPKRDFATAMRQVEQVCYRPATPAAGAFAVPPQAVGNDFAAAMRQVERHCYDAN